MRRRYSLGRSVLVWVIGALIGWIIAFGGIYYMIRTGDNLVADFLEGGGATEKSTATADNGNKTADSPISKEDLRELQEIAPAAGAPSDAPSPAKPAE